MMITFLFGSTVSSGPVPQNYALDCVAIVTGT